MSSQEAMHASLIKGNADIRQRDSEYWVVSLDSAVLGH